MNYFWTLEKFGKIWWNLEKFGEMCKFFENFVISLDYLWTNFELWWALEKFGEICKFFENFVVLWNCYSVFNCSSFLNFFQIFETSALHCWIKLTYMGTQGHAEVSFFDFPFRQFTFFQRVSNQRSFSFPLRGWSLLNVVLLVL